MVEATSNFTVGTRSPLTGRSRVVTQTNAAVKRCFLKPSEAGFPVFLRRHPLHDQTLRHILIASQESSSSYHEPRLSYFVLSGQWVVWRMLDENQPSALLGFKPLAFSSQTVSLLELLTLSIPDGRITTSNYRPKPTIEHVLSNFRLVLTVRVNHIYDTRFPCPNELDAS